MEDQLKSSPPSTKKTTSDGIKPITPRRMAIHLPYLAKIPSMTDYLPFFLSKAIIMSKKEIEASSILFTMPSTMERIKL